MDTSTMYFLCFLILLNVHLCFPMLVRERQYRARKANVAFTQVSPVKQDGFKTFREKMAKEIGIREADLATRTIQDWYNREYVATGKKIDYTDSTQRQNIQTFILSILCAACNAADCVCIRDFCNKACP